MELALSLLLNRFLNDGGHLNQKWSWIGCVFNTVLVVITYVTRFSPGMYQ